MSWHLELTGNFFAFRNEIAGQVRELVPFQPGEVKVIRHKDLTLAYEVTSAETGEMKPFPAEAIWHVRGPSWNSWTGIDWLQAARDAIGLALSLEESAAALHRNGVRTTGAWSVEGKLVAEQYKQLRDWIEKEHAGAAATGKPMIIDRAGKWVPTQMTAMDAQHREMRQDQIEEVCRFFGVLPIMVGYSDKATTYASSEQMFIAHKEHTLAPRWRMYEQSIDANLLSDRDRKDGLYVHFVEEGMIAGSAKDTKDTIIGYVNAGILTPNEGRELLDLNPDDDPDSDKLRIPVNISQVTPPSGGNPKE
jgi:HK97 family phage portal protein